MRLSLLTVTQAEPYAVPFLQALTALARSLGAEAVVAVDGPAQAPDLPYARIVRVVSQGYIESVLDDAVASTTGDYILRLDDDEQCSPAMCQWLRDGLYQAADHWKFPRVHLWGDSRTMLWTPHLFPDYQTRLSVRAKSGRRYHVHAGSPFGGGVEAPVVLEHWKFLIKTFQERNAIASAYDRIHPGYGTGGMLPFSLPELAYPHPVTVSTYREGAVPLAREDEREVRL